MIALLLAVLLPCRLFDAREAPLDAGIQAFVVQSAWADACHAPIPTRYVVVDITVIDPTSPGVATFWRPTRRLKNHGGYGSTQRPWDEDWRRKPTIQWTDSTVTVRATIRLGIEWMPPDLYVLLESRDPVRMTVDLVSVL